MKVAFVGSGLIVNQTLEALKDFEKIEKVAICVRECSKEKGVKLAKDYNIAHVYTDYDEMLKSKEFDFVYIGIINNLHFAYSKKALQNGKHLVVEKPFTNSSIEAQELIALAKENNLFLFEAITTLYTDNYKYVREQIKEIGKIKLVQCNFSQYSSRYDQYMKKIVAPAFDPECGGGALNDINVYNLHFVVGLFGLPREVMYFQNIGFNGVDTSGICILQYLDFVVTCVGAKDSTSNSFAMVQGTTGYVEVNGTTSVCASVHVEKYQEKIDVNKNKYASALLTEWVAFETQYTNGDYQTCYKALVNTEQVMQVLDMAKASVCE